jgi:hypothetical protein
LVRTVIFNLNRRCGRGALEMEVLEGRDIGKVAVIGEGGFTGIILFFKTKSN